jgi:pectin methylesterase-like acyl-CoA thioesterase
VSQVNITYNLALINTTSVDLTATVRAWTTNLKVYNLNILNTFGHISSNGQNLALSAHTTNQGYYGVGLYGYQDTLLANTGLQLYAKSRIVGAIDFIFGQTAQAWLENMDIRTIAAGCITASGRASNTSSWYVISNSNVHGINSTVEAKTGINYLGRPWGAWARVVFQYTYLSDVINPAGWSIWDVGDERISNVVFAEFGNSGPGSVLKEGPRANFSTQLKQPVTRDQVFGDGWETGWWVDMSYLV